MTLSRRTDMFSCIGLTCLALLVQSAVAGNSTWTGAVDGCWTNAANWTAGVPGRYYDGSGTLVGSTEETATFSACSGVTTIDLDGVYSIGKLLVTGAEAPRYTFGTSSTQILPIEAVLNGSLNQMTVDASVVHAPVVTAILQFGVDAVVGTTSVWLYNNSSDTVVVNDFGRMTQAPNQSGTVRCCTCFGGTGPISLNGDWVQAPSGTGVAANQSYLSTGKSSGLTFNKSTTLKTSLASTVADSRFTIASGVTLDITETWLNGAKHRLIIDGDGTLALTTGTFAQNFNGVNQNVDLRCKVVYRNETTSTKALHMYGSGIYRFSNYDNTISRFLSYYATTDGAGVEVDKIGKIDERSPLYGINQIRACGYFTLYFKGSVADETDRLLSIGKDPKYDWGNTVNSFEVNQSGSAALTMDSEVRVMTATDDFGTLILSGSTAADGIWKHVLADTDSSHKLKVVKRGTGRWIYTAAMAYTGPTTVEAGTFALGSGGSLAVSPVTLSGGTLAVVAAESKTLSSVSVTANAVVDLTAGSSLTLGSLSRSGGSLSVVAGVGASITCSTLAGQRPDWITLNGSAVEFNAQGVLRKLSYPPTVTIAARGDVVPNDSSAMVGIASDGSGGADVLAGDATAVNGIVQKTSAEAVIAIDEGQTLTASVLAVDEEGGALTLGSVAGTGTLAVPGNTLTFDAGSATAPITLNAALDPSFAGSVRKQGDGELKWMSPFAFPGTFDLAAGLVSVACGADSSFGATLTGSSFGTLRLDGSGALDVTSSSPDYDGDFVLNGPRVNLKITDGTVRKFGSTAGDLYVTNGASLHLLSENYSTANCTKLRIGNKRLHFAGAGADGTGALVSHEYYPSFLNQVALDGDATFTCTSKEAINPGYLVFANVDGVNPSLDMGGHTLDYYGNNGGYLVFNNHCVVTNAGRINVHNGILSGYYDIDLGGPEAEPIVLWPDARINSYAINDIRRKIEIHGTTNQPSRLVMIISTALDDENTYRLSGPIDFAVGDDEVGMLMLCQSTDVTNAVSRLSGKITGEGGFKTDYTFVAGDVVLENPTNDFSGPLIAATGGCWAYNFLWPQSPCRDYADVIVPGNHVAVWAPNWEKADIVKFANEATLQNGAFAAVNTSLAPDRTWSMELSDADVTAPTFALGHSGAGKLSLTGSWTTPIGLGAAGGTLELAGNGSREVRKLYVTRKRNDEPPILAITGGSATLGTNQCIVGRGQTWMTGLDYVSRLRVENATLSMPADSSGCSAPAITFGYGCEAGVLEIGPGADVSLFAYFGQNVYNAGGGGVGAVVQTGGKFTGVMRNGQTQDRIFIATGDRSWGAYELEGGELDLNPAQQTRVGFGQYASGVIHQSGGTAKFSMLMLGDSAYGSAAYLLMGGTATATGIQMPVISWAAKGFRSTLAVDNNASLTINNGQSTITVANGNPQNDTTDYGTTAIVDLLGGGRLFTKGFTKYNNYNILPACIHAYVNFDGGVLQLGGTSPTDAFSSGEWVVDRVVSYGRGAEIEVTSPLVTGRLYAPITAPSGSGVSSVAWAGTDAAKRRYIGTPSVDIVGDGTGASAMAVFDRATERVTGIRILAPGCDYTHAVAVIRADAQSAYRTPAWFTNACTLAANGVGGGLTVSGQGTVEMYATNTYSGATVLKGGTLKLMGDDVIKSGTDLVLAGGTLDLNNKSVSFGSIGGSGTASTVKNGTLALTDASWTVDCADLVADRYANVAGNVSFPANAKVSFVNCGLLDENRHGGYPVFQATGTISNMPTLEGTLPNQWKLVRSGGKLKLIYANALTIIIR